MHTLRCEVGIRHAVAQAAPGSTVRMPNNQCRVVTTSPVVTASARPARFAIIPATAEPKTAASVCVVAMNGPAMSCSSGGVADRSNAPRCAHPIPIPVPSSTGGREPTRFHRRRPPRHRLCQFQFRLDLHGDVERQGANADRDARMVADLRAEYLPDQGRRAVHQQRECSEIGGR
jgi:hypothetical protein